MLKVGFVLSQPFGQSIGTDVRVRGLLKGLCRLGVEVHVISPFDQNVSVGEDNVFVHGFSTSARRLRFLNLAYGLFRKSMTNPILFKRVFCRKSLLLRNVLSLGKGISEVVSKLDLDVLQSEQQIASLACIDVGKNFGVPVVADFHGIWAEEMVASGVIDYCDSAYKTLFELEREIALSVDAVAVVSEEMRSYVEGAFGVSNDKVVLVSNAAFPRVNQAKFAKRPSKVFHSGTLHPWENVELFVEAMPYVLKRFPSVKFCLTRKGAKLNKVMRLSQSLGVSPEFVWFDREGDFVEFLKSCDVGVISSTTHIARKMAYPAKLYDYLSVGLPIVANDVGAWTRIVSENHVGIVTENDPEAFANGIVELLENPKLLYECGQRGVELVKRELNYYRSAEKLLDLYKQIA